jgi:HEAT repeat protein
MVVTLQQVLDALNPDEPNYTIAAKLGPDALPHLENLVKTGEPMLASKAAYLASLIQGKRAVGVLKAAAQHTDPVVRVAAAAGVHNLVRTGVDPTAAEEILTSLKNDQDIGVRKHAMKSIPENR